MKKIILKYILILDYYRSHFGSRLHESSTEFFIMVLQTINEGNAGDNPCTPRGALSTKWRTEICPLAPRVSKPWVIEIDGVLHEMRTPCDSWPARDEMNKTLDANVFLDTNKDEFNSDLNNSN